MAGADTSEIHDDVVLAIELQREGSVGLSQQRMKGHRFAGFELNEVVPTAASFAVGLVSEAASPERSSTDRFAALFVNSGTRISENCAEAVNLRWFPDGNVQVAWLRAM